MRHVRTVVQLPRHAQISKTRVPGDERQLHDPQSKHAHKHPLVLLFCVLVSHTAPGQPAVVLIMSPSGSPSGFVYSGNCFNHNAQPSSPGPPFEGRDAIKRCDVIKKGEMP